MQYRCEAKSVDAFLAQIVRLVGNGYYFYFASKVPVGKDPQSLDRKIVKEWGLDKPYWKREKRYRGAAPNLWYLRYEREFVLIATHGKAADGSPHPFFKQYAVQDIRQNALLFKSYSIRYPVSKLSGNRQVFVRLNRSANSRLRAQLLEMAISARYRCRTAFEAEIERLPFQWYKPVREQVRVILKEANKRRRYAGFPRVRLSCVPARMRTTKVYAEDEQENRAV